MEETPRPGMTAEKLEGAAFRPKRLTDIAYCGMRIALGVAFIVHGYGKFGNEGFVGWMSTYGISPEFAMIIAAGEFIPGILLVIGRPEPHIGLDNRSYHARSNDSHKGPGLIRRRRGGPTRTSMTSCSWPSRS